MTISELFHGVKAEDWFYYKMPSSNTESDIEIKVVPPNAEYISIQLKSMRIVNVRKGLSKFYGAIHSHIKIPYRTGDPAQFSVVSTPTKLQELNASNIDRVINMNIPLLGPIPYRGGRLELEMGLFSIKSVDLAAPFLSLLNNISTLSGVSFIGSAIHYIEPLKQGIEILAGSSDQNILEIGLAITYDHIVTGNYVVMRASRDEIDENELHLDKDCRLIDGAGKSIKNYPYLVFEIKSMKHRDDYFNIPEISKAYRILQEEVGKIDRLSIQDALQFFKRTILLSNDLIYSDAKTIYDEVEKEINDIVELLSTTNKFRSSGSVERLNLKNLEEFNLFSSR